MELTSSNVKKVGDQTVNEEAWLKARKSLITASDVFSFIGHDIPSWWSTSRNDILSEKVLGTDRFGKAKPDVLRRIAWGREMEETNLRMFSKVMGLKVEQTHGLYVNNRWSNIGATLDAVMLPIETDDDPDTQFVSFPTPFLHLRDEVLAGETAWLVEAKHSAHPYAAKKVLAEENPPKWYISQVRTQLAIVEMDKAVLVYGLLGGDMRFYQIEQTETHLAIMDQVNEEFAEELANFGEYDETDESGPF